MTRWWLFQSCNRLNTNAINRNCQQTNDFCNGKYKILEFEHLSESSNGKVAKTLLNKIQWIIPSSTFDSSSFMV